MPTPELPRQPYPGLRPFEPDEADLFFGREQHVDALLARLSASHFVAVVGESGAGKSSLVRAGLLPALEAGFVVEAGSDWRVAIMRPGGAPLLALAEALLAPGVLSAGGGTPQREFALAELRRGPRGIAQLVRDAHLPPACNTLIVADQFEELFRYCRDSSQKDQANIFVELLLHAAQQRQVPIFVVLTMRSDFVGDCARFRGLPEMLNDNQYLAPRLTRDQIADAIREPARVCGGVVERDLVDRLCNAVGDDQDQLPLLQHLLMRIWDRAINEPRPQQPDAQQGPWPRLTSALSENAGDLQSALSKHAQQIYEALPARGQAIARTLFKCLTDPQSQRRDVRRDALVSDVAAVAAVPVDATIAVAEEFRAVGRHMLMPPPNVPLDAGSRLDISHESLIRQWTVLGKWACEEGANAREFLRLRDEAQRERSHQGELLSGRALTRAQEWLKHTAPSPAWAARYAEAGDLDATVAFIRKSEDAARRQKAHEVRAARRERFVKKAWWMVGGTLAVTAVVVGVIFMLWRRAVEAREAADEARAEARANLLTLNAERALEKDAALAVLVARAAVNERPPTARTLKVLRDALAAHVPNVWPDFPAARFRNYIPGENKTAWLDFALSPASVSSIGDSVITPSGADAIIWSTTSGERIQTLHHQGAGVVGSAIFSPDGRSAVTTGSDSTVRIWDVTTGQEQQILRHGRMVNGAAFNRDGSLLVTLADDANARIWTVGQFSNPRCDVRVAPDADDGDPNFILATFSHNEKWLATVTHLNGTWQAQVWNLTASGCPRVPTSLDGMRDLKWAGFSPYGPWLAAVSLDGRVVVLDAETWKERRRFKPATLYMAGRASTDEPISVQSLPPAVAWSTDGSRFAAAGGDNSVSIAPITGTAPPLELRGHTGRVTSISFAQGDAALLTTSTDRTARVWRFGPDRQLIERLVLGGHSDAVGSGTFSATGDGIVTAGDDSTVRFWKPLPALREWRHPDIRSAAYSMDGSRIVVVTGFDRPASEYWVSELAASGLSPLEAPLKLHATNPPLFSGPRVIEQEAAVTRFRDLRQLHGPAPLVESDRLGASRFVVSPNGRFLAVADKSLNASVWDLQKEHPQPEEASLSSAAKSGSCRVLAVSDDKQLAWYCPEKNFVVMTRPADAQTTDIAIKDQARVEAARFSTNGSRLAVELDDYSIRLFESASGRTSGTMKGHSSPISSLDFSTDDQFVVSVGYDSTTRVWETSTGAPVASVVARSVVAASFSPDGLSLVLRAPDRILLWRCYACGDAKALLAEAQRRNIERRLSADERVEYGLTTEDYPQKRGKR